MKITCDQCAARYSVGDDKVSGRTFKIRCKRCSHVIVVRGEAPAVAAEPPPADAWYAIVDGAQQGPWELAALRQRRAAGDLDGDTLVWREGLADWQAYALVPELAPSEPLEPAALAPTEVQPARAGALHGERNETSVLFTLGNLAQLAAPKPAPAANLPAGAAQGEGSGLIDIQMLARSMAPAAPARTGHAVGSLDDLPTYAPVGFVEPAVLVPARRTRGDRKLVVALGASVGLLAVVAVILVVLVLRRDTAEAAQPPARPVAQGTIAPEVKTEARPEVKTEATPEVKTEVRPEVKTEARPEVKTEARPEARPVVKPEAKPTARPETPRPTTPSRPLVSPTTPPTTPTTTPPTGAAPSEVECIMNDFKDPRCAPFRDGKKKPPAPAPGTNLPEQLTRDAITQGLGTISVAACSGKSSAPGEVKVSIKVSPEGNVSGVTVKASPGEATSACVIAAAQRGRFPKTQRGGSFYYVWRL